MRKALSICLISIMVFGLIMPAFAAEPTTKVDRGPKNVLLGVTEIPKAIINTTRETKNPIIGLTGGLLKGVLNAFARTTSGVYDTVTAPFNPKKSPDIKTEMVSTTPAQAATNIKPKSVKGKNIK